MGEKDIAEKHLEDLNDVFADIVNVLLFNGLRNMNENELEVDVKDSQFKSDGKLHEQERDVSKLWKNGKVRISIIGFENQTVQDYKMPLRIISYDGASYKKQLLDEDLHKYYPVVTMVLYFGYKERWTAPKNLYSCFNVSEELQPFVNDYKINVFEIAWLDDETVNMFQSDFKFIAQYFRAKRLNNDYVPTPEEVKHADELTKMFTALTGDKYFEKAYNETRLIKQGGITMCDIVQGFVQEGRIEGREQGKAEIIRKMLDAKFATEQQIADLLKISVEEVKKIVAKVPVQA